MTNRLVSLADHLTPLLTGLRPAPILRLPPVEAVGLIAAEDLLAPQAVPEAAVALRGGYAVQALELAGASPQSPAPLSTLPPLVAAGDPLPPGCDAILDPAALQTGRFGPEALEAVEPGAWVRLAGQDIAAGEPLAEAGECITREIAMAAALASMGHVAVRRPIVRLDWPAGAEGDWLAGRLSACGARLAAEGDVPDLHLAIGADARPRLALAPGEAAFAAWVEGVATIALPARFDAMVGAWCALALPILARLSGTWLEATSMPLARKIASAVGRTEIVLLRLHNGEAHPLAVGEAPLGRIARADAFAILDPGSEGAPAGDPIPAISLDRPFGRARSGP